MACMAYISTTCVPSLKFHLAALVREVHGKGHFESYSHRVGIRSLNAGILGRRKAET